MCPASLLHCEQGHEGDDEVTRALYTLYSAALLIARLVTVFLVHFPSLAVTCATTSQLHYADYAARMSILCRYLTFCYLYAYRHFSGKINGTYFVTVFVPLLLP